MDLPGAMSTISAAHMESTAAEWRSKASTSYPGSTVQESTVLRKTAEDKLSRSQKEFDRKHQRNNRKLENLSQELDKFNLTRLSEKVNSLLCSRWNILRFVLIFWRLCRFVVVRMRIWDAPPAAGWAAAGMTDSPAVEEKGAAASSPPPKVL